MEVTEVVARIVRRYWFIFLLSIAIPTVLVGAFAVHSPSTYTTHTRLMAAGNVPQAQAQADAVVSQVQAIATSTDIVADALRDAKSDRDVGSAVKAVSVTGFGSSGLVDISYTDTSPAVARDVDTALANRVIAQIATIRNGLPAVLDELDALITTLSEKRAAVATAASAKPADTGPVANLDRLISDLTANRTRLAQTATNATAPVIVENAQTPPADSRGLPAKLAIAVIVGLVLGLLLIGANETLRPGVSGANRVARLLNVPVLGMVSSDPASLVDIGRRIRLAGRRKAVASVVLVRADRTTVSPELVDRIKAATLRPETVISRRTPSIDGYVKAKDIDTAATQILTLSPPAESELLIDGVRTVCALEELDPKSEADQIGLVVFAGRNTRLKAVDSVRDLLAATGWPLLGVLGDPRNRSGV